MEFLAEYGLFLAKAVTIVVALLVIVGVMAAQAQQNKLHGLAGGSLSVRHINDQYDDFEHTLKENILSEKAFKQELQQRKKNEKAQKKQAEVQRSRIFYVYFDGDVEASDVDKLRQSISAILTVATSQDEVVVNVESAGGMVHTYGLAASQLKRIREAGIPLTICVDKVAASGGYLMACVADKILAAPFAIVGSIGVLAQVPNFNRALKRFDIDYEIFTAGEYKAPISMLGEITEKGRNKLREELESTHELFKNFITQHRPQVDVATVATGEVWYGQQAIALQLVDKVITSDDYLMQQRNDKDIFEVSFVEKKSLQEKLGFAVQHGITGSLKAFMKREREISTGKI